MTEEELAAIEARAIAATEGPWTHDDTTCSVVADSDKVKDWSITDLVTWENGRFIANARADVPALIAEVRRLRVQLAKIAGGIYRPGEAAAFTFQSLAKDALAGGTK